jgi:hypothetical protein
MDARHSPFSQNIRSLGDSAIFTRSGQSARFSTAAQAITDLRAYSRLSTDDLPRILARNAADQIYLDNGALVGTLAGGGSSPGATLIPFRPNASPSPYMYIANGSDYRKFSAPTAGNAVTSAKAGIAEPQSPPDSCPDAFYSLREDAVAAVYTAAGTAGAVTDVSRSTEVLGAAPVVFVDPASHPTTINGNTPTSRVSIRVGGTQQYQIGQFVGVGTDAGIIQDVIPNFPGSNITVRSVVYVTGASGRCSIALSISAGAELLPDVSGGNITTGLQTTQTILAAFRRGALVNITGAVAEVVMVLSATRGPDESVSIEVSTVNNQTTATGLSFLPTIVLDCSAGHGGDTVSSTSISSVIAVGTGTLTNATLSLLTSNLQFIDTGGLARSSNSLIRPDDYFHISINISDITQLSTTAPAIRIMFDVNNGAANFTDNFYYFDVQPSDLASAAANTQTQLGATSVSAQRQALRGGLGVVGQIGVRSGSRSPIRLDTNPVDITPVEFGSGGDQTSTGVSQWTEISFPLTSLTRVGNDETRTMVNFQSFRVQVIALGNVTIKLSSLWFGGGSAPDVGQIGAPYLYRVRPRSSVTGTVGNPSSSTRYGVSPHRQQVVVSLPSAAYDPQIDTWDVFRYGGTVTSWRYVGSAASSAAVFVDNFFDDAVRAGDLLDFDNFEPWPSIDSPFTGTASTVAGTLAIVTIPAPTNALCWLPGTQVILGGSQAFTLFARPTFISGTSYLIQFVENAGSGSNLAVQIPEPVLGNDQLPYMFGPDASGRMLACGDPLRPGTFSYSKSNNPDSCPDSYNRELVAPSEPLLGGEIIDGLAFIATPERWWALYPQQTTDPTQFYNPVQIPVSRGLTAPWGHCNNGAEFFWWAKDGIYGSQHGSLTDADLFNLFPHDGVPGVVVTYGGFTIQPPDYARTGTMRLEHSAGYLYATYQDSGGIYRALTLDIHRMAWVPDVYSPAVSVAYHPEQQAGTVLTSTARYDELLFGTVDGRVCAQAPLSNDLGGGISCACATFEYDGEDLRAPAQWGDFFVDLVPAAFAGVVVRGMSLGAAVTPLTTVPSGAVRTRTPVGVGGVVVSDFMGMLATWTDDYSRQAVATSLVLWEPSYDLQPPAAISWKSFGSALGSPGFKHMPWIAPAWVSTAPVTITFSVVDGTAPQPLVLPASGGVFTKQLFMLTANKGQMYQYQASSAAPFQLFMDQSDIAIGPWARTGPYDIRHDFGITPEESAVV